MGVSYTQEQENFLKTHYYGISRQELADMFNAEFGTNKSIGAIKSWCNNRGLNCGSDGKFKNGHTSWQTGLMGNDYRSHFTEETFKKSVSCIIPKRKYEIGDTFYKSGEFYVLVSTDSKIPIEKRGILKRRYVYEKAYGKIPKQHIIIQLDGDKSNFDLDNLYCIPQKYVPLMNKNHWYTDSREHTLSAIKWCELYYALKENKKCEQ